MHSMSIWRRKKKLRAPNRKPDTNGRLRCNRRVSWRYLADFNFFTRWHRFPTSAYSKKVIEFNGRRSTNQPTESVPIHPPFYVPVYIHIPIINAVHIKNSLAYSSLFHRQIKKWSTRRLQSLHQPNNDKENTLNRMLDSILRSHPSTGHKRTAQRLLYEGEKKNIKDKKKRLRCVGTLCQ